MFPELCYEECFEGIAARKISERIKPDYVVIGESSELNLKRGQRGRAEVVVETFGKPAHSANPRAGINAVYKMAALIGEIGKLKAPIHEILGEGILELTDIKSSPYPGASVVPDYCRATYDRRLLVGETKESVLQPLLALIEDMKRKDAEFEAGVHFASDVQRCYTGEEIRGERFFPGWVFDKDDEFVQAALMGLRERGVESGDYAVLVLHQRQPLCGRSGNQDHRVWAFAGEPGAHRSMSTLRSINC